MNTRLFPAKKMLMRSIKVIILLSFALPFAGFAQKPERALAQSRRIVASIAGDWFWTADFIAGAELSFHIYDSQGGNLLSSGSETADEAGFVIVDYPDHGVDLLPGHYLVVSDGSITKGLVLETITMDVFDLDHDFMAGTAPKGREVWAFAGLQDYQDSIQVTADLLTGIWAADFSAIPLDINEDMRPWSYAHIYDDDGDANEAGTPPPGSPVWRDEFDGVLQPGWSWVNEEPSMWSLTENPGFLRIYTSPSPTGGQNLLLRPAVPDDFAIQTRVLFGPVADFQIAGLVIWQDAANFLQFGRAFCDVPDVCVGNGIYFDKIENGDISGSNYSTVTTSQDEAYLRLLRQEQTLTAFYSEDGIHWMYIGEHVIPDSFHINAVGLTSSQNFWAEVIPADFDYFALAPSPSPDTRIVYRYHAHLAGEHFAPGSLLTFSVYEAQGASEPLFELTRTADESGSATLAVWERPVDMVPGNYVVVTDGITAKDLVLEPVSMDVFDLDLDLLEGTTLPGEYMYVWVANEIASCYLELIADPESGAWRADFGAISCNVVEDMSAAAMVFDEDGDVSEAGRPSPPTGYHDYDQGDVPSWACNAGGWAIDPDNPYQDINVRILVDGVQVMDVKAENYRQDLEISWNEGGGGCPDGTCAFEVSLWDYLSHYEEHEITVEAQDLQSGEWYTLNSTPKTLTCRTYDIYAFDPLSGETRQITNLRDTDEYSPSWAPFGNWVAHDVVRTDGSQGIFLTNVRSGVSIPLAGAEDGGNDAAWSPNGVWIAFDRFPAGDHSLYVVPPIGGRARLVIGDAISPAWSPTGLHLVFHRPSDGSIRTVDLLGRRETVISTSGQNPVWSPDGRWIAFEDGGDIWKVRVSVPGMPLSTPIQVTQGSFQDSQPTWSANSQTIAFHSGFGRDYDIWTVPAAGGMPSWLTGAPGFGDFDPAYAKSSPILAYTSFSPAGQAERTWVAAYTYDLPAGYWSEGPHRYHFEAEWSGGDELSPEAGFNVSNEAPSYEGYVLLRPLALRAGVDGDCPDIEAIRPDQLTRFLVGYTSVTEVDYSEASAFFDGLTARALWDETNTAQLVRREIIPFSLDWFQYVCTFTK